MRRDVVPKSVSGDLAFVELSARVRNLLEVEVPWRSLPLRWSVTAFANGARGPPA